MARNETAPIAVPDILDAAVLVVNSETASNVLMNVKFQNGNISFCFSKMLGCVGVTSRTETSISPFSLFEVTVFLAVGHFLISSEDLFRFSIVSLRNLGLSNTLVSSFDSASTA